MYDISCPTKERGGGGNVKATPCVNNSTNFTAKPLIDRKRNRRLHDVCRSGTKRRPNAPRRRDEGTRAPRRLVGELSQGRRWGGGCGAMWSVSATIRGIIETSVVKRRGVHACADGRTPRMRGCKY